MIAYETAYLLLGESKVFHKHLHFVILLKYKRNLLILKFLHVEKNVKIILKTKSIKNILRIKKQPKEMYKDEQQFFGFIQ